MSAGTVNAVGRPPHPPAEINRTLNKAVRREWVFLGFLLSIIVSMAIVMGSSQTMKAMWVEDTLSLVPSIAFLIGAHYRKKQPTEAYPYGYRRAVSVGFLCGAVALCGFGIFMVGDSGLSLLEARHATIPTISLFAMQIWMGWFMLAALIYSVIPPFIFGRMKAPLARKLHDKTLHVSAELNKGDWMSGIAGVIGILGIAYGLWWTDSAAALFISVEILKDGYKNLRNSVAQLMNKRPTDISSQEEDPTIDKLQQALEKLDWILKARVRLREHGDLLTGEVFIQVRDERDLLENLEEARKVTDELDWRLYDVSMVPVRTVD